MTATYPDDAVFNANNFSVVGTPVTYTNTGAATNFNINRVVNHVGETLAIVDGLFQDPSAYTLSNGNFTVTFLTAPAADNVTIKAITIPANLTKVAKFPNMLAQDYGNNSVAGFNVQSVDSNTYDIDGVNIAWAVPAAATAITNTNQLIVTVSGIVQQITAYTFPSSTLDTRGIDISPALPGGDDTLTIRTLDTSFTSQTSRCNNMSDKKPDRGQLTENAFDTSIFSSQAGYEKRRLISRKGKRSWQIAYTNISGLEKDAIKEFFDNRFGNYETFFFDLTHVGEDSGTAFVRFDGVLQINLNRVLSDDNLDKYFSVAFKLQEVFD